MVGQAERIFELNSLVKTDEDNTSSPRIISITSGKGGTGKSFLASNLSLELANNGYRVLLVDLDINLANQAVLFNITAKNTLYHYLMYNRSIEDLIQKCSFNQNLFFIMGESGKIDHPTLTEQRVENLILELKYLSDLFDVVILDTASGIENGTLQLLLKSDEIILVTTPEPTSVMDGYVINKLLKNNGSKASVGVIVNKCFNKIESQEAFENLHKATKHFLKKEIIFLGEISFSESVIRSIQSQSLIIQIQKSGKIHHQISKISAKLKIPTIG